ncbi:sodium:calcium antiporter [Paludibacterium paludis]|uniref:Membrane protein n=1 Tax=Paludibacterium paludis TaxID=1225769 RepID=A0A918P2W0_9NEIS|nr:sodium:calcium antiporter [Paludibacterium paludis]GGY15702.1 membrane protein [Paludibacterium paludis]
MLISLAQLALMLLIILVAAEIFTNALEHLGEKLGISEGVTGSLFAAVGTAMPETLVPLLAILGGSSAQASVNEEIGVGAILGAPLMLSTLSTCLMGAAVLKSRGFCGRLNPEKSGLLRDLNVFLIAYSLSAAAMFVTSHTVRGFLCAALVLLYFIYVLLTIRASAALVEDGHGTEAAGSMFLEKLRLPVNFVTILLQLALGLALLVSGARGFIDGVESVSGLLGITPLLLSLMIVPIATELPEKINSILWVRKGKDTLAFGNITGAMVFQGTLLPAIGISLTPWVPRTEVFAGITLTLAAAAWLRLTAQRGLKIGHLMVNGALYLVYLWISLG